MKLEVLKPFSSVLLKCGCKDRILNIVCKGIFETFFISELILSQSFDAQLGKSSIFY
jgi:predicted DNA-binding antitoxin AbrB/MazE fold protein